MKNFVKFSILTGAILGTASIGQAQATSVSGNIQAKADVKSAITVAGNKDLVFGTVYRNQAGVTIDATAATAGNYWVGGPGGTTATATLTSPPSSLAGPGTATLLISNWTLATSLGNIPSSCTTPITSGNAGNITMDGTAFTDGKATVCVGAKVAPISTQALGNYAGGVTLTVAFP